jgi:hypothetical protein
MKKCISLLLFIAFLNVGNAQIYVDVDVAPNGNGSSWANAFNNLQDAIDAVALAAPNQEIWVAAGTYLPTKDHLGNASPTDNRDKNFHLATNMKIYGGFLGTEALLSVRNAATNITILSGDFNNNDAVTGGGNSLIFNNINENAYHVIITTNLTSAAVIDGFTVKGGNANGNGFISYQARTFYKNSGGGMHNSAYATTIANIIFIHNNASYGGGMYNESSSSIITNSTFTNNRAELGGGMFNGSSSPTITNATFTSNSATNWGGGMYNSFSSPVIINSTFTNNFATNWGGGMYNSFSSPTITNSTFMNNSAINRGGGMFKGSSLPTVMNSIIWNNVGYLEVLNEDSTPTFKNSIIKGSVGSWNNLATYPLFMNAANGAHSLQVHSKAIDAGDNTAWTNTSLGTDIAENTRPFNSAIVDMGAYEYQGSPTAISMSIPTVT